MALEANDYLRRLNEYLKKQLANGEITQAQYNEIGQYAASMLNMGVWGTDAQWDLPYYYEVMVFFKWPLGPEEAYLERAKEKTPPYLGPSATGMESQLTPNLYLSMLGNYLTVTKGWDAEQVEAAISEAQESMGQGVWGPALPHWLELYNDFMEYQTGLAPEVAMTPEEEFEWWKKRQDYLAELEAKTATQLSPYEKWLMGFREEEFEWEKQQAERQWLAEHAGPADWITRWMYMHSPQGLVSPTGVPPTGYSRGLTASELASMPQTPPAPAWLQRFVPGTIAGQPIQKLPVTTPSGQQWSRTPWSVKEGLRGYAEWAGYRPYEDIVGHMAMMQPQTPRGAGSQSWRPIRQWAV